MGNNMGNKIATNTEYINPKRTKRNESCSNIMELMVIAEEFKLDFMSRFTEQDKGTKPKIDAVAFYGDFIEILIVYPDNIHEEIKSMINDFENKGYHFTDTQKNLINKIISEIPIKQGL